MAVSVTSCKQSTRNKILIPYIITERPDPLNIDYSGDWIVAHHLWSTLIELQADGSFAPLLAKDWKKSLNGKIWMFTLRENLKWSDGSTMEPAQIVNSLQIAKNGTSHTDLSKLIESIELIENNKIQFKLKAQNPQFLNGIAYIDWAITHPDELEVKNGQAKIKSYKKSSGPFKVLSFHHNGNIIDSVQLERNPFDLHKINDNFKQAQIVKYTSCQEIKNNIDQVASFRMYRDELSPDCKTYFEKSGFIIHDDEPSWIIKADFTTNGIKTINLNTRIEIIKKIHQKLKNDFKNIGNIRATGLRSPRLYGSLTENEFDSLLSSTHLETKASNEPLTLKIITVDLWSKWKSYQWLIQELKNLNINVEESIFSMSDFQQKKLEGKIQINYDLLFIPLGVSDTDPDGTWRMAASQVYPDFFTKKELFEAYTETNELTRELKYKEFAEKLLREGRYIPLVMNSDIIGIHKDYDTLGNTSVRKGATLFELE